MRHWMVAIAMVVSGPAIAEGPNIQAIVETHILPGYEKLAAETADLATIAEADCQATSPTLKASYHDAFDAWINVSHLRFGPSENSDRAFALAFWPDTRGSTPKALAALIRDEDPSVYSPDNFATVSVAARGFYALEFLLFDEQTSETGNPEYICALIKAISTDIAANSAAILKDWASTKGLPRNQAARLRREAREARRSRRSPPCLP